MAAMLTKTSTTTSSSSSSQHSPTISRARSSPRTSAAVAATTVVSPPTPTARSPALLPRSPRCRALLPPSSTTTSAPTSTVTSTATPTAPSAIAAAVSATAPSAQPTTVDASTQYSPLGYPPTLKRPIGNPSRPLNLSPGTRSGKSKSVRREHSSERTRARPTATAQTGSSDTRQTASGAAAAAATATTATPRSVQDAAGTSGAGPSGGVGAEVGEGAGAGAGGGPATAARSTSAVGAYIASSASSLSSSSSSSAGAAVPSSPKRSRTAMDRPVKVMPLRYETCNPADLGVLISDMLNELVRLNDDIPLKDGQLTRFHSRAPPGISVRDYLNRLIVHATLSPPILLSMVYYIDRLCALYPAFTISSLTVHRFLITAATVAAKGLGDSFWTNSTYARVGGVSVRELALLELEFLGRLEWRIVPKPEVLVDYYKSLVERSSGYEMEKEEEMASDKKEGT